MSSWAQLMDPCSTLLPSQVRFSCFFYSSESRFFYDRLLTCGLLGYPIASLPLGYLNDFNGRPFGLVALASAHQDALLVRVQSAWEVTFPKRRPPPLFTGGSES
jgi:hypothetical protein